VDLMRQLTINAQTCPRRSIRLTDYDYSQEGAYFVTICAHSHKCLFGKIVDGVMRLNRFGNVVNKCWLEIPHHFPNMEIDTFIIMPNHFHGIVAIVDNRRGTACRAPTKMIERFGKPTTCSLPTIVRSFKSAATKRINVVRGTPGARLWQSNYYEHVIRNETDLNDIRQYLLDNPVKWDMDEESPTRQSPEPSYGNIVGARHAVPLR
jgi:putative transposase